MENPGKRTISRFAETKRCVRAAREVACDCAAPAGDSKARGLSRHVDVSKSLKLHGFCPVTQNFLWLDEITREEDVNVHCSP